MSRNITRALVLSVLGHYLLVLVFLRFDTELSIEKSLPVVNVQLQAHEIGVDSDDSMPADREDFTDADSGSADSVPADPAQVAHLVAESSLLDVEAPRNEPPRVAPLPTVVPATANEPLESLAEAEQPAAVSSAVAVATTVNTQPANDTAVPVAGAFEAERLPVSDADRGMLEKKFRRWSEDLRELAEDAASLDWEHQGHAYTASFRPAPAAGDMDMGHVVVEVTKEAGGTRFTTRLRMKNLSFSNYSQFIDRWNPNVAIHDDESDGRFHSNSTVHLAYSRTTRPVFFGKVTTAQRRIDTSGSIGFFRRSEIFLGGLETGVKRIRMPKRYSPFPADATAESDRVRVFNTDTRIRFYPDGSYGWQPIDADVPEQRLVMAAAGAFLVGASKAALHVSGTLDGRVLVYSPERIVIEGDLVYADPPDAVPESDDYLGLVTDRVIEIAGPEVTGPGDVIIHAAMYARRKFTVSRFTAENDGTLSIHGSLAAGSMSATEPRFGTRIRFDQRLEDLRPPRFPLTDRYETVAWDSQWEVREDPDSE